MTESRDPVRYAIYTRQPVETPDMNGGLKVQRPTG